MSGLYFRTQSKEMKREARYQPTRRTASLFEVVSSRRGSLVSTAATTGDVRHFQHSHRTIEQAVHDLETGRLVAPYRSGMPHVTRLALARDVLEHDIGRLKDAYRQRVRPILPYRLQ